EVLRVGVGGEGDREKASSCDGLFEVARTSDEGREVLDAVGVSSSGFYAHTTDGFIVILHIPPEGVGVGGDYPGCRDDSKVAGPLQQRCGLGEANVGADPMQRIAGEHG